MADYPNISDHGLIGDLQTAALVDDRRDDRLVLLPPFRLAERVRVAARRERWRLLPDRSRSWTAYVTRQLYLPGTAILVTRFMTEAGVGEVVDFMPVAEGPATDRHRLVRLVRVVRGTMRFVAEIQPRFDYARKSHKVEVTTRRRGLRVRRPRRSRCTGSAIRSCAARSGRAPSNTSATASA